MEAVGVGRDNLLRDFYRGKRILVTGHTGFKGSWLSIWLKELEADVIGYALDPRTKDDIFIAAGLKDKIVDVRGDIRDIDNLQKVFLKYKPEIVFHLAAQPLVIKSYESPRDTYEINVMGTLNVLECIRNAKSTKVGVMITTDKCYENKEQIWGYRETDPLGGYDPYSSSKGCAEILIASYRSSFMNPKDYKKHGKSISSVRAGNVIGGGDWSENRLVPDCIRALINNKTIEIRNPYAIRPWQHVLEPLSGYLQLANNMYQDGINYSSAWNFGPNQDAMVKVGLVVDYIVDKWNSGKWVEVLDKEVCHEANLLSLDCAKAKTYLGWSPKLSISEAIEYTVECYKNYLKDNVYDLCKKQIDLYNQKS